jgi:anti-sigma-K factor RskA
MKDEHIINLIESMPLSSLGEGDLAGIRAHIIACVNCERAFEAAQISSRLLKERAADIFEPSPFFHTRVMASLRERQTANDFWQFSRLWRTAGALASSMVATVAALAVLTFINPGNQIASAPQDPASFANNYSAEEVILGQNEVAANPISDGQVLTELYGADEDQVR